jgi:hypothetical protein
MTLGELSVTLGAVMGRFNRNMADAGDVIVSTAGKMRSLVNTSVAMGAAAAAAGVAIVTGLVKAGLESVAAQAKLAISMDATIDGMRALAIAGDDLGLKTEEVNQGIGMLNQRLGEFQRQGGPGARMLAELGLKLADLAKLDADKRLAAVADRVKALGLSASQAADLARQLGLRGAEWGTLLRQGGDAIRQAREDVDKFGLSISEVDAQQVLKAQNAMENIGRALANVRDQIAIALAPVVAELADRLNHAAAEAGGFRQASLRAVEIALLGFAKVGDVIHGLRTVFKGVQLVADGFGSAVISVVQMAAEGIIAWVDLVIAGINKVIAALNKLPRVDIAKIDPWTDSRFMQGLRHLGEESRNQVGITRAELHELATQELPSQKVERFFDAVRDRAKAAAEETVNARNAARSMAGGGVAGFGVDNSEAEKEAAKAAEDAKKREAERQMAEAQARLDRIASVREALKTEADLEVEAHYAKLAALEEMSAAELEQIGGYQVAKEELEKAHMQRLKEIREAGMTELEKFQAMSYRRQVATVAGSIADMTAGVASGNKKMFELNKVAALAQTALDLPAAIIASYRNAGGWPLGAAAAAAMAAAGAAQIAQIKNAKFGGGGGGGGGGASASGAATPAAPRQVISVEGLTPDAMFSGTMVRGLLTRMQEAINDGATLVV